MLRGKVAERKRDRLDIRILGLIIILVISFIFVMVRIIFKLG